MHMYVYQPSTCTFIHERVVFYILLWHREERMVLVYMLYIHRITSTQLALEEGPLVSYAFLSHRTSV